MVTLVNKPKVTLEDVKGTDDLIVKAARVSIQGLPSTQAVHDNPLRLIGLLMREGHHVPFEHASMTFGIECSLSTQQQLLKHRMSSISQTSARYREMQPRFYAPPSQRPLTQSGPAIGYEITADNPDQANKYQWICRTIREHCTESWDRYQAALKFGIPKEVARDLLPTSLMTTSMVTVNLRSLFNLLSLRTVRDVPYPSHPQYEIAQVATAMESHLESVFPVTHTAFVEKYGMPA